ncbi:MAG TPA: phosphodiesterase [Burkholderiales bacterium]|nr:phosphodiesterase [Burkholderiales bacterium]
MIVAQITDLHLTAEGSLAEGRIDTAASLARCIAQIIRLDPAPDVLMITGDLANLGHPEEYIRLRRLLAPLNLPTFVIPGNHDDRSILHTAFDDCNYLPKQGPFLHYVVDDFPLRLIALDTVVANQGYGALCADRLDWIKARLGEARTQPTLIFMHHPPFATGIAHMDAIRLLDGADAFGAIVAGQDHIKLIACGHVHRTIVTDFHGTPAVVCPSTAHQIVLNLHLNGPAEFDFEPPGFMLHVWDGERIITHNVPVGDFDGPFAFED